MISTSALSHRRRRTLETVFAHPTAHNLAWSDVVGLLRQLGQVTDEANGKLRTTVAGHSVSWEPERSQLSEADVLALRDFLQSVGVTPEGAALSSQPAPRGPRARRAVVVMTYRDAKVSRGGSTVLVEPFDRRGHLEHLHERGGQWRGFYREPQPEYFARVAEEIRGSDEVLLLGHGQGHSNAMLHMVAYLRQHEPDLARRVAGAVDLDVGDLTDADVENAVADFFGEETRPSPL